MLKDLNMNLRTDATTKANDELDHETNTDSTPESNDQPTVPTNSTKHTVKTSFNKSSESKRHKARHDIDYNQLIDNVDNFTVNNTRDTVQTSFVPTINNTVAKDSETTIS